MKISRYQAIAALIVIAGSTAGPDAVAGCTSTKSAPQVETTSSAKSNECCPTCGGPVLTFGGQKKCLSEGSHKGIAQSEKKRQSTEAKRAAAKKAREARERKRQTPPPSEGQ